MLRLCKDTRYVVMTISFCSGGCQQRRYDGEERGYGCRLPSLSLPHVVWNSDALLPVVTNPLEISTPFHVI